MFWDSSEKTCERTQTLGQAFCKCNEMTPGPNDLVVCPSEAGTMLNCHLSAPSPASPPYTHPQKSAYVLKGLLYWTFRDFWTWMYSTNVMDVEYLHSKFFSIGHKQNILSFSHPRSSGLLWNGCLLWTSLRGSSRVPQGGWNISSLAQVHEGQQRLHMLDPPPHAWSPS